MIVLFCVSLFITFKGQTNIHVWFTSQCVR